MGAGKEHLRKETKELGLDTLVRAFNHPLRFYYQQNFQLRTPYIDEALEEVEPFALDFLEQFQLRQDLLALNASEVKSDEDILLDWQLSERIPAGVLGDFELQQAKREVAPLRARLKTLEPPEYKEIDVILGGQTIGGKVLVSNGAAVAVYSGKSPATSFFGFWVQHVFWNLAYYRCADLDSDNAGVDGRQSLLVGKDKVWTLPCLTEAFAEQYAEQLLNVFESLSMRPTMFLPKTAFAMLFGSASAANTSFYGAGGNYGGVGESQDFYWRRACLFGQVDTDSESPLVSPVNPDHLPEFLSHDIALQVSAHVEEIKELSR